MWCWFFQNIKISICFDFKDLGGYETLRGLNDLNSLFGLKK